MYDFQLHNDSKLKDMVRLLDNECDRVLGICSEAIW